MADNHLGVLKDYGPHIFALCIILYCLFYTYLDYTYQNEDDDENF